jgi:hypothetical protein
VDVAIRNLLRAVDILPIAYGVGGVSMFVASKCQRLGDLAAGTVVVLEVVSDYSAHSDHCVQAEWDRQASAEALRATGLSPQEFRALYNYYMRRNQLSLRARQSLLPRLLAPVLQRRGETLTTGVLEDMESYVDLVIRQAYQAESQAAAGERQPRPPGAAEGRT